MSDDTLSFRVVAECCGFDCIPEECPLKESKKDDTL